MTALSKNITIFHRILSRIGEDTAMKILATFQVNSNPNDDECAKLLTSPHVENKLDEIIKYACKGKEKIAECIEQ